VEEFPDASAYCYENSVQDSRVLLTVCAEGAKASDCDAFFSCIENLKVRIMAVYDIHSFIPVHGV
jgi:hypothetical protein